MVNFFRKRLERGERSGGGDAGPSRRDFSRDNANRKEMNTELPKKALSAQQALWHVTELSEKADLTDHDVSIAIRNANILKEFYKKYQKYLGMNEDTYKKLTGEFTEQRNTWVAVTTPSTTGFEMPDTVTQMEETVARIRRPVLQTTLEFLRNASRDLQDRINPGTDTRAQIRREVRDARKSAMDQQWRNVLGEGREIPDYDSNEWARFVSEEHGNILEEKKLTLDSRDAQLISDIMIGGKINEIRDAGDRDSSEYRNYMNEIYNRYEAFQKKQVEQAEYTYNRVGSDQYLPSSHTPLGNNGDFTSEFNAPLPEYQDPFPDL